MSTLSFLIVCTVLFAPPSIASREDNCTGCIGAGGTASASGGTCGGMITITVEVEPGTCRWIGSDDELLLLGDEINRTAKGLERACTAAAGVWRTIVATDWLELPTTERDERIRRASLG